MSVMDFLWGRGRFRTLADNEVALEDLPVDSGDPVKFRMATKRGYGIGVLSINRLRDDGVGHDEVGMIFGKLDDRYPGKLSGMWDIFCQDPSVPGDLGMKRVMEIFHDKVVFHKPVFGIPAGGRPTRFYSDDGRFCFNVQGDDGGKIVQYNMNGTTDESKWTPVAQFKGTPI